MKKIAISVSGQTRGHNQISKRWMKGLFHLFDGYDIDLYGHTWDYCELPKTLDKFKEFHVSSPEEIWTDFVQHNLFERVPFKQSWTETSEWEDILITNDFNKFMELCKQRSIDAYAQIYSFIKSLEKIKQENYDAVFRYRWDLGLSSELSDEIAYGKKMIRQFLYKEQEFSGLNRDSTILSLSPIGITKDTMHDVAFLIDCKNPQFKTMKGEPLEKGLSRVIRGELVSRRLNGHELWYWFLKYHRFVIASGIPNSIFTLIRGDGDYNQDMEISKKFS